MSVENHTKIANFPTPVYLSPPLKGFPWNCVSAQGSQETRMMLLSDGRKLFQIGLAVLIQYRRVTRQPPSQPPSQTRCRSKYRAYCVGQVKSIALPFIGRFRRGFQLFSQGIDLSNALHSSHFRRKMAPQFYAKLRSKLRKVQKSTEKFVRTSLYRQLRDLKKILPQ